MSENDSYLGKTIHENNYRICKKIGYGGFGTVYLAKHRHLEGKQVVIKFLDELKPLLSDEERAEAFEKVREEGNILQNLQHKNILHIEDIGVYAGRPYLILPNAEQGTLRWKMNKILSLDEILTIIEQAGEALHYMHMHEQGIVHGDVKPENLLFDGKGLLLLADMGNAARLMAMPGAIGGTPPYMAPEQFQGITDARSDQYALGCVAYELLTSRLPVTVDGGEETQEEPTWQAEWLLWAMQQEKILPQRLSQGNPTLPLPIELAILKALAKKPQDRHADVATFVQALRNPSCDPSKYDHVKKEWVQEGDRLCQEQRYPEALEIYHWVKQFATHDPEVYRRIAQGYMKLGQDASARCVCEQIIRFAPGDIQTLLLWAKLCDLAGDFPQALAVYRDILRLAPGDQEALHGTMRMSYQSQQWPEALTACEQLLGLVPGDQETLRLKVATLYQLQRYQEVVETCDVVLQMFPDDPDARTCKREALSAWGHVLFERKQ